MKRSLLILIPVSALLLFLAVQAYMINSILGQKEKMLLLQYKTFAREGMSLLVSEKKANGFEKSMAVLDKFSGLISREEIPYLGTSVDTIALNKESATQVYSIIRKSENLTAFLKNYLERYGLDQNFSTIIYINRFRIYTDKGPLVILEEPAGEMTSSMIHVNTFREEHNNFDIEFSYLIDLTHKKEMVLREALLSLSLIAASIIIVLAVFWLSWRNLMEEKRLSGLKTDFINNMTHELKTPLSTITVAGRTLEKEQILNDQSKILETARLISKQSVHLNQLINSILEVSLLERTEFELNAQETDIKDLTRQVTASFLTACDGCAVIEEDYPTETVTAMVDALYYTTVINNLLINAVKYCITEPVIKISVTDEDGKITVSVSDNGIGIDREHLDHIFEKFYRVPHGNIHKTKGLGLGLYYVHRIVKAHHGDITVASKPGRGTTFKIKLPK